MSFKDKHSLETLPATITALAKEITLLEKRLADSALYASDPKAFAAATSRLSTAQAERVVAEERWLELEILREEMGA